jgi:hypothetical protein
MARMSAAGDAAKVLAVHGAGRCLPVNTGEDVGVSVNDHPHYVPNSLSQAATRTSPITLDQDDAAGRDGDIQMSGWPHRLGRSLGAG